jgi:hypothetical protein
MDRMQVCGTCDPGSIPGESTREQIKKTIHVNSLFYLEKTTFVVFGPRAKRSHVFPISNAKTDELGEKVLRNEVS